MAKINIRYLTTYRGKRSRPRYFWQPSKTLRRAGWRLSRLPDEPIAAAATAERINEAVDRWRAGQGSLETPPTITVLVGSYRASRFYEVLKPETKRGYDRWLATIAEKFGDLPVASLREAHVQQLYDWYRHDTPTKAVAIVNVLHLLLAFAQRKGFVTVNVADNPGLIMPRPKPMIWSPQAVQAFVAAADARRRPSLGSAVCLNEWLGQREGDLIRLTRAAYRDGCLHIVQAKTSQAVALPVDMIPHLRARLEAELARHHPSGLAATTILVSETSGRPYTPDTFRMAFAKIRDAAAADHACLAGLQFMHLRHTAVTRLAELGCSSNLIAAVTGHAEEHVERIIARYLVRTEAGARTAFAIRLEAELGMRKQPKALHRAEAE